MDNRWKNNLISVVSEALKAALPPACSPGIEFSRNLICQKIEKSEPKSLEGIIDETIELFSVPPDMQAYCRDEAKILLDESRLDSNALLLSSKLIKETAKGLSEHDSLAGEKYKSTLYNVLCGTLFAYAYSNADEKTCIQFLGDRIKADEAEIKRNQKDINVLKKTQEEHGKRIRANEERLTESKGPQKPVYPHLITLSPGDGNRILHRDKDAESVMNLLNNTTKIVLMNGTAGIGKTSLARLLFSKLEKEYEYVGWVTYQSDLAQSLCSSIMLEGLPEDDPEKRWKAIMLWLQNEPGKKLLFIDNVDEDSQKRQDPAHDSRFSEIKSIPGLTLILTSRYNRLNTFTIYSVQYLDEESCIDLFYHYYKDGSYESEEIRPNLETVKNLVHLAGCHTYAVELLAKGCDSSEYSNLDEYYNKVKKTGFRISTEVYTDYSKQNKTVAEQLKLLFDIAGKTKEQMKVLWNYAVISSAELTSKESKEWFGNEPVIVDGLVKTGWLLVRETDVEKYYSMHPLAREVIFFDSKDGFAPESTAKIFLNLLIDKKPEFLKWQIGIEPSTEVHRRIQIVEDVLHNLPERESYICVFQSIGMAYIDLGELGKALKYHQKALEIRKKVLLPNHLDIASSYNNIGGVYRELGESEKALKYHQKALDIREKTLPPDHPDLASSYINIGNVYRDLGDNEKALEQYKKALSIFEKIYLADHPFLALSYNNIGNVYLDLRECEKALEQYKKALSIYEKVLPPDYSSLATSYNNIGAVYIYLGESGKALKYCQKALGIREKVYSPDHPELALIYNNIGLAYNNLGDPGKALEYYQKTLDIREKALPPDHPDLASGYNNIGTAYSDLGENRKAFEYYQKALDIRKKALPAAHLDLASSYNNMGTVYSDLGENEKALKHHQKALDIQEKVLPPDHPDFALSYNNIGGVYSDLGEKSKALEYLEKALDIQEKVLPPDHPDLALSYNNIGLAYNNLGDPGKALEYFQKALDIRKKVLPPDHTDLASSYNNIGNAYSDLGEPGKALEYYQKALGIFEKVLPPDHPKFGMVRKNIRLVKERIETENKP